MTSDTNLRELMNHSLAFMRISECGNWIVFVTETGHELRFCAYGVVEVTVDSYWDCAAKRDKPYHSYKIQKE
jgi:hypothetical protein